MERVIETLEVPNSPRVIAWYCPRCGTADSTFANEEAERGASR
jgi:hypothetical protein